MATEKWKQENKEKMRAYRREWYANNRNHAKAKVRERQIEITEWFQEFKRTLKCEKCSEDHPACLEFHHNDPSKKEMTVGQAVTNGWSKEKILEEVKKCSVLCANCHRKFHFEERQKNRSVV